MSVTIEDEDGIFTIHTAVRLQSELIEADEKVEEMILQVFFEVKTQGPSGKIIGKQYWDLSNPLILTCKENPELAAAMKVIQEAIGVGRYLQITTSPKNSVLIKDPGILPPHDDS